MFQRHIPTLDGLRGFAALWVVISHLGLVGYAIRVPGPTGEYGVFLFFILSGFLMGHLYLPQPFSAANVSRYGIARLARVVPIFYLAITACFVISEFAGPHFIYFLSPKDYLRLLTFNGSAYTFWSVAAEVQFYGLFLGLWWLFSLTGAAFTRALVPLLLALSLVLFIQPVFPGAVVFSKLPIFLAGVLLAALVARLPAPADWSRSSSITVAQLVTIAIAIGLTLTPYFPSSILNPFHLSHDETFNAIYGDFRWSILMAVMLLVIAIDTPVTRTLLCNRFMRLAGQYSFSIYLLHVPVMAGIKAVLDPLGVPQMDSALLALTGVAALGPVAYYIVERPSQDWCRRHLHRLVDRWIKRPGEAGDAAGLTRAG